MTQQFVAGDPVRITAYTMHAPMTQFWPYPSEARKRGRQARFVRYMAGNVYAIVAAEEWGYTPAQDVRVRVEDLTREGTAS